MKKNYSSKIIIEDLERLQKKFVEDLESLRKEEQEILELFGIRTKKFIFINSEDESFSFSGNHRLFINELSSGEKEILANKERNDLIVTNQSLSKLRILREKANSLYSNAQKEEKIAGV